MTYGQFANYVIHELEPIYGYRESKSIQRYLFTGIDEKSPTEWLMIQEEEVPAAFEQQVMQILPDLKMKMPVQYAVGKTWFYDFPLSVTPAVLIPRPETEELVKLVISDNINRTNLTIADIGTGSGAISIALAKTLSFAKVTTIDISFEAIEIARKNAMMNDVEIHFIQFDILKYDSNSKTLYPKVEDGIDPINGELDIVISNPPYVKESEKAQMQANVLEYEPHLALFVSDSDPLIFYRAIIEFSLLHLSQTGILYFEINENEGESLSKLLKTKGFNHVELHKDINDKDRFIKAYK